MTDTLIAILNWAGAHWRELCLFAGGAAAFGVVGYAAYWVLRPTDPVAVAERAIEQSRMSRLPVQQQWQDRLVVMGLAWTIAWQQLALRRACGQLMCLEPGPEYDRQAKLVLLLDALVRQSTRALALTRDAIDARAEYLSDRYVQPIVDMRRTM